MNKKIPTPLAILTILLVIAVIIGVAFWICPQKEMVPPQDENADWQTYRNEEYGFEIKYPGDFLNFQKEGEAEDQYLIVMFGAPEIPNEALISVILYKNEGNLTLFNWIEKRKEEIKQEEFNVGDFQEEEILTDSQEGIKLTYTGELGLIENYYFFSGEVIYEFSENPSAIKGGKLDRYFNQILSTFRFLN